MIFNFHTPHATFEVEDKEYFEKKLYKLHSILGSLDRLDTIKVKISIHKNNAHSGKRFESIAHVTCDHHGVFNSECHAENIKKCADLHYEKLYQQIKKFHDKKLS